jgi:hypothetical protein
MAGVLVGYPSSNVAPTATPSWVVGTPASGYPVANVLTLDPGEVAKANEMTATLRLTWLSPVVPVAILLIHTNFGSASSVTASNNGGMTPIPVTVRETRDGLGECGWVDMRGVAGASCTQLNIAAVGTDGPVAIGTIIVLTAVESPRTRWEYLTGAKLPKIKLVPSSGARDFVFARPTKRRKGRFSWHWAEDRAFWRRLWEEAYSVTPTPFALIPDEDDSDAMLVQFVDDEYNELNTYFDGSFADNSQSGLVETQADVLEVGAGAPLD